MRNQGKYWEWKTCNEYLGKVNKDGLEMSNNRVGQITETNGQQDEDGRK